MFLIERTVTEKGRTTHQAMLYVTSLTAEQADPADLLAYVRQHWELKLFTGLGLWPSATRSTNAYEHVA